MPETMPDRGAVPTTRALSWPMLAAFAVVVVAFQGATWVSRSAANAIHGAAHDIAGTTSPSIEHLANMRNGLLDLEVSLIRNLETLTSHGVPVTDGARADLEGLVADKSAYESLPFFPGEGALWSKTADQLDSVRQLGEAAITELTNGNETAARAIIIDRLPTQIELASTGIFGSIRLNASLAHDRAEEIEADHALSGELALALGGLASILAVFVAWRTTRALQQYGALQEEHTRLLQERAEELELFSARVAHDVMSPLGAASMAMEMAQRHPENREQVRELVGRAQASLTRVHRVVDGLFDFARAGARPSRGASSDVAEVVQGVIEDARGAAAKAGLQLVTEPVDAVRVVGEPGVLVSLLSNLVNNAIKYSDPHAGGTVTLRGLVRPSKVRFEVEDHGPGLAPGLGDTVFEPYVRGRRLDRPGLGLGLATVKRLSEAHGGACGVHSVPGRGCLFWFELPRATGAEAAADGEQKANASLESATVDSDLN